MTNTKYTFSEDERCIARFTIADGVMRGQRVQCLKKSRADSQYCGTHRPSWERANH